MRTILLIVITCILHALHAQTFTGGFYPASSEAQIAFGDVPAAYQPLYSYLYGIMVPKQAAADALWKGPPTVNVLLGSECTPCDAYGSLNVTQSEQFLAAQRALGLTTVKMIISAPMLYPPFWSWCASDPTCSANNPGETYASRLAKYQTIVAYGQSIGLYINVQEDIFPEGSVGSQSDQDNLVTYYATLNTSGCPGITTTCGYYQMRVTNTINSLSLTVYPAPLLITVIAEPSTEGQKALPASDYIYTVDNPSTWVSSSAQMATGISAAIEASGVTGLHTTIKIDMGDASFDTAAHITSLDGVYLGLASHHGVDCVENHIHPIFIGSSSNDPLANTLAIFAQAAADSNPRQVCENETSLYIENSSSGSTQAVENLQWPCYAASLFKYFENYVMEVARENNAFMVSMAYGGTFFYCVPDPATCTSTSCNSTVNPHISANIVTSPVTYSANGTGLMAVANAAPYLPPPASGGRLTGTIGYNVAASTPSILSTTPFEVAGGFSAFTIPTSLFNLMGADPMQVSLQPAGTGGKAMPLVCFDAIDSGFAGSSSIYYDLTGRTNFVFACQRDVINKQATFEVWNLDGSNYSGLLTNSFTTPGGPLNFGGYYSGYSAGTGNAIEKWAKIWTGIAAPGTFPLTRGAGTVLDVSFTGTGPVNSLTPAPTGPIATFLPIIQNPPYLNIGNARTVTGSSAILTASAVSLSGGTIISYNWREISGPSVLTLTNGNTANATITGMVFGDYKMLCVVVDSTGLRSEKIQDIGWVPTDANGFTAYPSNLQAFFGKSLPLGSSLNQWPYYDSINQQSATYFASLQNSVCILAPDGCYVPYWNTPGVGTVSGSSGGYTLSFSGVNPATQWCGGGTSPSQTSAVVLYTNSGANRYVTTSITACTSTTLTLYSALPFSIASASYGYMDNNMLTTMSGQSTNADYYDNVQAFYNLYYRSGLTVYLTAARYLADFWWNGPYIDQANFTTDPNGNRILHPRQIAFAGLVLRALDGQPGYWTGLENIANFYSTYGMAPGTLQPTGNPLSDTREDSYSGSFSALIALFDPTPAKVAAALTTANNIFINVFEPARNTSIGSSYPQLSYGEASWNGSAGTVTVINGSTTVTGTGTSWSGNSSEVGNSFWTTTQSNPTSNSYGDAAPAYLISALNPTTQTITLNTPYTGSSASGKYWQINNLVGIGNQPYMMGITYQFFRLLYLTGGATSPSTVLNRMAGIVTYLTSTSGAYTGSPEYGLWYGRINPNCEPTPSACSGTNAEQARSLTNEIMAAISDNYARTLAASDLSMGNTLFGAMYSGPANGYSGPLVGNIIDGYFDNDIESVPPGVTPSTYAAPAAAKWLGFKFGFALGPWWPAQSLVPHI